MKQYIQWMTVWLTLAVSVLYGAHVEAVLSDKEVVKGNMAQLQLVAQGESVRFPKITKIDGVPVLAQGQRQNTSLQIINGKSKMTHTYTLTLTFEPTKDMTIPPFEIEVDGQTYKTEPLTLKVVTSDAPVEQGGTHVPLMLTMKADKTETTVGEPIVVTVYFAIRDDVRLSDNPQYQAPDFQGFLVKEIPEQKRYQKGDYHITELRYILTPEKEGNVTIAPARAKVGLLDTSRRDLFGRFFGTVWKPLKSNALHISVKPLQTDAELIGKFTIDDRLDKTETKPNKPVNLTVTIQGEGSLEDFEFPPFEIPGVSVYSDDAQLDTRIEGGKVHSRWQKKFVFIGDGDFTIPPRSITAFDPDANRTYTLQTHPYRVHVQGGTAAATSSAPSLPPSTAPDTTEGSVHTAPSPAASPAARGASVPQSTLWLTVVAAFLAGMATLWGLQRLLARRRTLHFKWSDSDALRILYPHTSEDKEAEAMVRLLYAKKRGEKVTIDKKKLKELLKKYEEKR